nr:hypothetical protein [Gluconacetobacter johannae]
MFHPKLQPHHVLAQAIETPARIPSFHCRPDGRATMKPPPKPVPEAAMELVDRHGDAAVHVARMHRDEAQEADDAALTAYWNAILETVQYFLEEDPKRVS